MLTRFSRNRSIAAIWRSVICFIMLSGSSLLAADMKLEARLIWGTNDEQAKPNHKVLQDPRLSEDLRGIFKWKHYYEITNRVAKIAVGATQSVEMSKKCTLKIKHLGNSRIEVDFFGNGKLVNKGVHSLPPGERVTLAGNDKNDSAWFIVLEASEKSASKVSK